MGKGTNLRGQTEPKRRFSQTDSRRFSLILAFSWKTKHLGNADFRRKPQIFAGNSRKPQEPAENRRLAFVPLGSSPYARPYWKGEQKPATLSAPQKDHERKSNPKSKFWGRISGGRPRACPSGRLGAKTSVKPSKSWKKASISVRTSMTRRHGRPWVLGVHKNFGQKNFGLYFRSLKEEQIDSNLSAQLCRISKGPHTRTNPPCMLASWVLFCHTFLWVKIVRFVSCDLVKADWLRLTKTD